MPDIVSLDSVNCYPYNTFISFKNMHTIQKKILASCKFYNSGARYSNLKKTEMPNDKFNYHLQQLVQNEFLHKRNSKYYLSEKGKSLVTNLQEDSLTMKTNYKVSVYLVPIVDGQVLLYKRLKHPQYGYVGFISEKMKYGENMLQAGKRGFKEETTLDADFTLVGNLRQIRKNEQGTVIEDGIFYVLFTDGVLGELREKSVEGEYFWKPIVDVPKVKKLFRPSAEIILDEIRKRMADKTLGKQYFIYELEPAPENY